jgi:PKD repeat protein
VQNPYYLYTEPGTYDVTLIVTDTNGETAATTLENYITVTDGSAVSGAVAGVWTQTYSPYNIIGTMTIEDGANLTIEPGVVVNVSNDALIEITGSITADASAGQAITIRGTEDRYSWQGIRIQYTDDVSLFDNVYIEDASDCALDIEDARCRC